MSFPENRVEVSSAGVFARDELAVAANKLRSVSERESGDEIMFGWDAVRSKIACVLGQNVRNEDTGQDV